MKYYTVKELAEKLNVSEAFIYSRINSGIINKAPNMGRIKIPGTELTKLKKEILNITDNFFYDDNKVEVIETFLGSIRKIIGKPEYLASDVAKAIGLSETKNLTRNISEFNKKHLSNEESKKLGFRRTSAGFSFVMYEGIKEYSGKSYFDIDWDKFLKELKPIEKVEEQLTIKEVENNDSLAKVFEGHPVEIIEVDGDILFELYSTGMALGYATSPNPNGRVYPNKTRIDKVVENGMISTCLHGVRRYLTESDLYDFMLEAKTDKCKSFRKWITNEVLPTIRKTGGYVNNTEQFTENYFSNLSKETRQAIKNELDNKNQLIKEKIKPLNDELEANLKVISLIDETF